MNLQELESQTRTDIERALTQLQTATRLLSALDAQILASGDTLKNLSYTIEHCINTPQNREAPIVRPIGKSAHT